MTINNDSTKSKETVNSRLEKILEITDNAKYPSGDLISVEVVEEFENTCDEIIRQSNNFNPEMFFDNRNKDIEEDYHFTRKTFRDLIEKGNEALDNIMKLAAEMESPRGYEVMAILLKSVADTTKELLSLQKTIKELIQPPQTEQESGQGNTLVNNAIFVGSTKELQEILKNNLKKQAEHPTKELEQKPDENIQKIS